MQEILKINSIMSLQAILPSPEFLKDDILISSNLYICNDNLLFNNTIITNILLILAIICAIYSIISKNTIISVLFLIGLYVNISAFLILIGLHFIGLSYILIYVGAISILFIFILMLINIRISELFYNTKNSISLLIIMAMLLNSLLFSILYNINIIHMLFNYNNDYIYTYSTIIFNITNVIWDSSILNYDNINSLGNIIYNNNFIIFIEASIILLLAMIGAIVITIKPIQDYNKNHTNLFLPIQSSMIPYELITKFFKIIKKPFIIFSVGLLGRILINEYLDINVFIDYLNVISLGYYGLLALFSNFIYNFSGCTWLYEFFWEKINNHMYFSGRVPIGGPGPGGNFGASNPGGPGAVAAPQTGPTADTGPIPPADPYSNPIIQLPWGREADSTIRSTRENLQRTLATPQPMAINNIASSVPNMILIQSGVNFHNNLASAPSTGTTLVSLAERIRIHNTLTTSIRNGMVLNP